MEIVKLPNYHIYIDNVIANYDNFFNKISKTDRLFVITDEHVYNLHKKTLESKTSFQINWYVLPPGDSSKSIENALLITNFLFENDAKRSDIIISFGGGMVTDITGMVASIYNRGLKLIHIPTTVIGQVDSAIGGKTGLNYMNYKNVLGTFYDPKLVIIETDYLITLPKAEVTNGLGELIKTGFIGDRKILKILETNKDNVITVDLIKRGIEVKKQYVINDYYDEGARHVLNLGHTFGHAIEAASNFKISHGQAVIAGMIKVLEIGIRLNITNPKILEKLEKITKEINFDIPIMEYEEYRNYVFKDKKSIKDGIKLTILEDMNQPALIELTWNKLDELASKKE